MDKNIQIGPGFFGTLTIAFIVLKLCSIISWGWLWILSPMWIPLAAILGFFIIMFLIVMTMAIISGIFSLFTK